MGNAAAFKLEALQFLDFIHKKQAKYDLTLTKAFVKTLILLATAYMLMTDQSVRAVSGTSAVQQCLYQMPQ